MPRWLSRVSLDPYIRQRAYSLPCRAIPGTRQRIKTCGIILDDISLPCAAPLTLGKGLAICHLLCLRHSIDLCDLSAHGATVFVVYLPKTLAKASAPLATRKRLMAFLCRVSHLNKWQSFFAEYLRNYTRQRNFGDNNFVVSALPSVKLNKGFAECILY
jgi:hypothetical protein